MPYIKKVGRVKLDSYINDLIKAIKNMDGGVGELNYVITKIISGMNPKRYADMNDIIGMLECAKLEFYRRKVVPYEELKTIENGDIPEYIEKK